MRFSQYQRGLYRHYEIEGSESNRFTTLSDFISSNYIRSSPSTTWGRVRVEPKVGPHIAFRLEQEYFDLLTVPALEGHQTRSRCLCEEVILHRSKLAKSILEACENLSMWAGNVSAALIEYEKIVLYIAPVKCSFRSASIEPRKQTNE